MFVSLPNGRLVTGKRGQCRAMSKKWVLRTAAYRAGEVFRAQYVFSQILSRILRDVKFLALPFSFINIKHLPEKLGAHIHTKQQGILMTQYLGTRY